jgi:hypothetical protein
MRQHAVLLAALLLAGIAQAAPTDEQCSNAANLAEAALEARQAGITEDAAMDYLRHQGVYSGLPVWAVKQAYDAPANVSAWMLKGHVFGACKGREE